MWHVLSSVPRIYLCVEDMNAFIVVYFITKAVRGKVVQEQNDRFLHVLIITFIPILSVIRYTPSFFLAKKLQHLFLQTFQEIESPQYH